ncbi:LapA family protein [Ornithinimicrobium faecis]|uniref:LapA family protein n=1 Tax=Ornithinimicrobium faecis TaxID=2934158 RepID=UPI0021172EC0|nr:LapA family protein [Ornithinimicrobium sp. HY1745]
MSEQRRSEQAQEQSPVVTLLKAHWITIVLALLAITFIAQNTDDLHLRLLWMTFTAPLWLALTPVALIGVAVGWMLKRRSVRRNLG